MAQGCAATVCMPVTTPAIKVDAVRRLGGRIDLWAILCALTALLPCRQLQGLAWQCEAWCHGAGVRGHGVHAGHDARHQGGRGAAAGRARGPARRLLQRDADACAGWD